MCVDQMIESGNCGADRRGWRAGRGKREEDARFLSLERRGRGWKGWVDERGGAGGGREEGGEDMCKDEGVARG